MNINDNLSDILGKNDKIPDIVLVKKKYNRAKKRIWKLAHMDKDVEMKTNTGKNKDKDNTEHQYEEFLRDIEEDKDMRKQVNLYKVK
jgi:nonsense-mediated mRNA decay protein 3